MIRIFKYFVCLCLFVMMNNVYGQEVIEIKKQEHTQIYLKNMNKVKDIEPENPKAAIKILETLLEKNIDPHEEFGIICWRLPDLYTLEKEYNKFLKIWINAQEKKYFFPFRMGNRPYPEFLPEIEDTIKLQSLLEKNKQLKEEFGTKSNVEYFVNTPNDYSKENKYPLFMVIHGGWGSHVSSMEHWHTPEMQFEYIVAYIQGSIVRGTYLRSFDNETGLKNIKTAYKQIIRNYSVDTTKIVIGGPSAGGMRSVLIALDNLIPAKGLILAFPVKPRELESSKVMDMAIRRVRVAIIGGENDWGLRGQKEMAVIFDKLGVANRFVIFPQIDHEYPPEFTKQINQSLDFIWRNQ